MRRVTGVLFALLFVAAISSRLSAQQSIYMLVETIKGDQPAPHDGEFKLNSFSSASENKTTIGSASTGMSSGRASFSPVKVSMRFNPGSSAFFSKSLATGAKLPSVEIRFYNSSNRMFYKTVYETVLLTSLSTEASDEAQQQMEFVFGKVRWFASPDASGMSPPVVVGCWDIMTARGC